MMMEIEKVIKRYQQIFILQNKKKPTETTLTQTSPQSFISILCIIIEANIFNTMEYSFKRYTSSFCYNSFETHKVVNNGQYDAQILESIANNDNFGCRIERYCVVDPP